jgi:hypothetical protein
MMLKALEILAPIAQMSGKIHVPWSRKRVQGPHFYSILKHLKPGAILCSRTDGELTNLLIPGHRKHAAIFGSIAFKDVNDEWFDYPYVIEALGKGVVLTDLVTFMTSKDEVILLYPKFATDQQMSEASKIAHKYLNSPYDYYFKPGNSAFYCSELIMQSYKEACVEVPFKPRIRLGVETIIAEDYVRATDKFQIVWRSHEN